MRSLKAVLCVLSLLSCSQVFSAGITPYLTQVEFGQLCDYDMYRMQLGNYPFQRDKPGVAGYE